MTRDSFLPFGSCNLCLLPTRDPVACTTSKKICHLFCRECALSNLVAQKKEIKRVEKERERRQDDDAADAEARKAEDDIKAVADFEAVQMGLEKKFGAASGSRIVGREGGKVIIEEQQRGTKRKLEIDEDELTRLGQEQKRGRAVGDKGSLTAEAKANTAVPSFWIPSATPFTKEKDNKPVKLNPLCPASEPESAHDFSLKTLITLRFHEERITDAGGNSETVRSCPSCNKSLSNSTKAVLAKPCGHVVCKPCGAKFMQPSEADAHDVEKEVGVVRCYVCQADVTERKREKREGKDGKEREKIRPGLVDISTEGTGFAGGGKNMVKKKGVAFQC